MSKVLSITAAYYCHNNTVYEAMVRSVQKEESNVGKT